MVFNSKTQHYKKKEKCPCNFWSNHSTEKGHLINSLEKSGCMEGIESKK